MDLLMITQKLRKNYSKGLIFEYDYLAIFAGTTQKYSCPPI